MVIKAILCVESLAPSYGGPAYSVRRLGYELARLGVKVGIWTFDGQEEGSKAELLMNGCIWLSGDFNNAVRSFGRPDIVHDNSIWRRQNHQIAKTCTRQRIARIVSTRGMLEPWAMAHGRLKKKAAWLMYQRRDLNRAQLLHATADSEAQSIAALSLTPPVTVIPNGVDLPPQCLRYSRQERTALFLSRIHPKKGIDLLISAWARASRKDWRLRIVGPGDSAYIATIKRQISEAGLDKQVVVEGPIYGAAKSRALKEADLFVLPSHSENFGIAVAEALASGLPAITTTGTPWKGLHIRRCGWWVEPSVDGVADALEVALALPSEALIEMGQRGREFVETEFGWEVIGRSMISAYELVRETYEPT